MIIIQSIKECSGTKREVFKGSTIIATVADALSEYDCTSDHALPKVMTCISIMRGKNVFQLIMSTLIYILV